jgi:ABC-2 type transport system permease protein
MIPAIIRTAFTGLRRDRGALILSFILPVAFFSIFAIVFGAQRGNRTPRISMLIVDEDHSATSQRLVEALKRESALNVLTRPEQAKGAPVPADYISASAENAVKQGVAPAALIIPKGFGANPVAFGPGSNRPAFQLLHDSSDPIAPQMIAGLLQKVVMSSMGDLMADAGVKEFEAIAGGLTPQQRQTVDSRLAQVHRYAQQNDTAPSASSQGNAGGMVNMQESDVVGEKKTNPMISFEAAGIGVMFLLFTASAAGGTLLDEAESGTLDRVLSSRVSMTSLLAGKMAYCTLLAFGELSVMFLWAWAVFHLDLFGHLSGFLVMGLSTAFAVASFGMVLASVAGTRAQQAGISTLLILTMSAIGGSMFPRFLMPEMMRKIGLVTFNAWAIDGFTKVFWRDEPVMNLMPQVAVLLGSGIVLFVVARRFAKRWEYD